MEASDGGASPLDLYTGSVPTLELDPETTSPWRARDFIRRVLETWDVDERVTEDVALVITELVTNAVIHARPAAVEVTVSKTADSIHAQVSDDGTGSVRPTRPEVDSVTGRGLHILDQLCTRWQVDTEDDGVGKTVRVHMPRSSLQPAGAIR